MAIYYLSKSSDQRRQLVRTVLWKDDALQTYGIVRDFDGATRENVHITSLRSDGGKDELDAAAIEDRTPTTFCSNCGRKARPGRSCEACGCYNSSHFYQELKNRNRTVVDITHKYRYYGDDYTFSLSICHNCRYWMYHPLLHCYTCGKLMTKQRATVGKMKETLQGYKEGY